MHVNTFENDDVHQTIVKILYSCSARLTRHSLDVSPWLTHKFAPFSRVQIHNGSFQQVSPILSMVHAHSLNWGRHFDWCVHAQLVHFYLAHTSVQLICTVIVNQLKASLQPTKFTNLVFAKTLAVPWCSCIKQATLLVTLWATNLVTSNVVRWKAGTGGPGTQNHGWYIIGCTK